MSVSKLLQGDIVLMPFPMTDLAESPKPRPAIVISNKIVNKTNDVILAAMTTTIRNDEFSFSINPKDLTHPLANGEIRCHKLFTAKKSIIIKKISALKKVKHKDLFDKISEVLKID